MSVTEQRQIDQSVFVAYGQAVLGMQAIEQSLKIAMKEIVIELDQATDVAREEIERLPLGALIDRFARIAPSQFSVEMQDLRNFKENRNYVAHHFFVDFIAARDRQQNDGWAIEFLRACEPEVVLALHE